MLRSLKFDFPAEWCGVAFLAALAFAWGGHIHFHLAVGWHDATLAACALGVMLGLRLLAIRKGGLIAEYFLLTTAASMVFGVLSYLALASSGALVDGALLAADRVLGFDWLAGYHVLLVHPVLTKILQLAYDSLIYQGLYFGLLLGLMNRKDALRDMFWLVFITGLFTLAGAALFPALGPFKTFAAAPAHSFLPEMEHLKSGRDLNFALAHLTGVVSFPSFHTSMALAYAWGFRRTGTIGWAAAVLNLVMLAAIPWFGGHYLTDMLAGAVVMLASLALVKAAPRLWRNASPVQLVSA
jgi:hypothetical protein